MTLYVQNKGNEYTLGNLLGWLGDVETPCPLLLDLPLCDFVGIGRFLGVLLDEESEDLSEDDDTGHEDGGGRETGDIPWCIGLGPEEDTVDGSRVTHGVDKGDGDSSFLCWETDDVGNPDEDERADTVDRGETEDDEDVLDDVGGRCDTDDEADTS